LISTERAEKLSKYYSTDPCWLYSGKNISCNHQLSFVNCFKIFNFLDMRLSNI